MSIHSNTKEIAIQNEFFSHGRLDIDQSLALLLLNMTVNHSALSIHNRDSIQPSSSKDTSSSFSEIRVLSITDELQSQEQALLEHQSTNHDLVTQVFCSSQDERVTNIIFSGLGHSRCDW